MQEYVAPELDKDAFNCPHCNAYANMYWYTIDAMGVSNRPFICIPLKAAKCVRCYEFSLWIGEDMIIPSHSTAPMPHNDMPELVKKDYLEAREILNKSPRGACALLRLALQKLCNEFVKGKKDINEQIAELVKQGLPSQLQKAFDIVRIVGNNSVHPGEINVDDNPEIALMLFKLINMIIEKMITEPNELKEFYEDTIPEKTQKAIKERNERVMGVKP